MPNVVAEPRQSELAIEMTGVAVASLKNPESIVLEDVNWSVAAGDFWAIGGLHASGKSDFMALAAGIMPPARGTCRIFGQEIFAPSHPGLLSTRLRLGLVFDGGQLLHDLTLAENIALPLRYHRDWDATKFDNRVDALLELTGLASRAQQTPGAISRNWQQRAGLARALALAPDVLLLDNPLSGLDPKDAAWWLNLLDQLFAGHPILDQRPVTLVVTGDDLRPWQTRARQFAVLKGQSFILLGSQPGLAADSELLVHLH